MRTDKPECKEAGCVGQPYEARGYCTHHYNKAYYDKSLIPHDIPPVTFTDACDVCGTIFNGKSTQKRCSRKCRNKADRLMRKFNMKPAEYKALLDKQDNVCAICMKEDPYQSLGVDHNHVTGRNRELLCSHCNTAIGSFRESIALLERAKQYLIKHSATPAMMHDVTDVSCMWAKVARPNG